MGNSKPAKNGKARRIDLGRRSAASLRKRGYIWWTHFGYKGQFFRRSLGTSDRSKAKREAEKLIALAEAGKIQATASSILDARTQEYRTELERQAIDSPDQINAKVAAFRQQIEAEAADERKAQKSASLKKSDADPKLNSAMRRRNKKAWDKRDKKSREQHSEAIKAAANRPGARKLRSDTTKSVWQRPGYRDHNVAAVNKTWKSRKLRKQQSKRIKAACDKDEVKAHRLAGRYRAAETLLKQRGAASDGGAAPHRGRGRPSKAERNREAARLKKLNWTWRQIAEKLEADFAENPEAAMLRVRIGAWSAMRSKKQETPR